MKYISKSLRNSSKLEHYYVAQGSCTNGKNIFVAFEQKPTNGKKWRIKIAKYTLAGKLVKVSGAMKLGHANDMTIVGNTIYVTHSGNENVIHRVNATTLKKGKNIKVKLPKTIKGATVKQRKSIKSFNGIATTSNAFLLRVMGGGILVVNKKFIAQKYIKIKSPKGTFSPQGIETDGEHIYRAFSYYQSKTKNEYCVYDMSGKLLKTKKLNVTGELESVFLLKGKLHFIVYRKYKKGKKMHYEAHLITL